MPSIILHYFTPAGARTNATLTVNAIKGYDKAESMGLFPRLRHEHLDGSTSTQFKRFQRRIFIDFGVIQSTTTMKALLNFMLDNNRAIEYSESELVANGNFATSASWTFGAGWAHDAVNDEADHTAGNTADLEQTIVLVEDATYWLSNSVANRTAGSVTPKIGGTVGSVLSANGSFQQLIKAGSGSLIEFTPTTDFDGSIDTVSVKRVVSVVPDNVDGYESEWIDGIELGSRFTMAFQERVAYADPADVYA